jgi:dihydroxy-acid dehydratase
MLNGWHQGRAHRLGHHRLEGARAAGAGEIDYDEFMELVASSAPSTGYCNTMGTATTMNSLAEALGMQLPGCGHPGALPRAPGQMAYETGKRIVDMVKKT